MNINTLEIIRITNDHLINKYLENDNYYRKAINNLIYISKNNNDIDYFKLEQQLLVFKNNIDEEVGILINDINNFVKKIENNNMNIRINNGNINIELKE